MRVQIGEKKIEWLWDTSISLRYSIKARELATYIDNVALRQLTQ